MLKRTITGIIMAGFLFLILWLNGFSHFIFDGVVMVVAGIASWEMYRALSHTAEEEKKSFNVALPAVIVAWLLSYPFAFFFGYMGLFFDLVIASVVAIVIFIFKQSLRVEDCFATVFCILYPIGLISVLYVLDIKYGMIPVVLAIAIGTISDLFAYFIGALFGKRKIFPKISPKKTYAGCIAGLIGGAIGGIVVYLIFELGRFPTNTKFTFQGLLYGSVGATIGVYAAIGFVIAFFSEIGDLAASRIKREVGIKDYGKLLGSHGGILDRIDSILFTSVCMAIIMEIVSLTI